MGDDSEKFECSQDSLQQYHMSCYFVAGMSVLGKTKPVYELLNESGRKYVDLVKLRNDLNVKSIPNHLSKLIFSIISTNFFLESNN